MSRPGSKQERRKAPRVERIQLVEVSRFEEGGLSDLTTGRTLNLSRGGARLELHYSLPLRSTVELSIVVEEQVLQVPGKVVYLEAIDDQRTAMGIAFNDVPPETQAAIDAVVADPPSTDKP